MSTNNTTAANDNLDLMLPIRATSGGERGKEGSGVKHDYLMPKSIFMAMIGQVFDKEFERTNPENEKSGGAIAQFCHSYGATADKQEKSGIDPFPEAGGTFNGDNVESWLEVMKFKAPKGSRNRKSAKEVRMDAILTVLTVPGVTWELIKGAYGDVTSEELEAYKVKLATPKEEPVSEEPSEAEAGAEV